jgi:hypothetical protein
LAFDCVFLRDRSPGAGQLVEPASAPESMNSAGAIQKSWALQERRVSTISDTVPR